MVFVVFVDVGSTMLAHDFNACPPHYAPTYVARCWLDFHPPPVHGGQLTEHDMCVPGLAALPFVCPTKKNMTAGTANDKHRQLGPCLAGGLTMYNVAHKNCVCWPPCVHPHHAPARRYSIACGTSIVCAVVLHIVLLRATSCHSVQLRAMVVHLTCSCHYSLLLFLVYGTGPLIRNRHFGRA